MKHGHAYRDLVESLFARKLTTQDAVLEDEIRRVEERLRSALPLALREYYLVLGRFDQLNTAHNRLLKPEELELQGGMLRFMDENQCVCTWALRREDLGTEDPEVYQGNPIQDPDWYREELRLSEFLQLSIYLQAAWGGLGINGDHMDAPEVLGAIEAKWSKVVDNGELRIWRRDGMLISHLEEDTICICAARDERSFEYLERELGFEEQ